MAGFVRILLLLLANRCAICPAPCVLHSLLKVLFKIKKKYFMNFLDRINISLHISCPEPDIIFNNTVKD